MTNSQMMISLLRRLKVEMNGAVVGAMEARGLHYALSYGVSLPTIKTICVEYAPNHSLSRLLYRQDVRELRLAAIYIADPTMFDVVESAFWSSGIITGEIAEVMAMVLLSRSPQLVSVVDEWLRSDELLVQYCALMTVSRCRTKFHQTVLTMYVERFSGSSDALLCRAAELIANG